MTHEIQKEKFALLLKRHYNLERWRRVINSRNLDRAAMNVHRAAVQLGTALGFPTEQTKFLLKIGHKGDIDRIPFPVSLSARGLPDPLTWRLARHSRDFYEIRPDPSSFQQERYRVAARAADGRVIYFWEPCN